MRDCPNGHRDPYVIWDAGAGTGSHCPTCGEWLDYPPDRWGVWPLIALVLALALISALFWWMFLS